MLFKSHRLAFLVELPTDAFSVTPGRSNVHFISTIIELLTDIKPPDDVTAYFNFLI